MLENRIYTVVVKDIFYGTFSNRKNMLDSIKDHVELTGAYIKGSRKNLDITPVTIANGFIGSNLTIYKKDENGDESVFMKVLMHNMNSVNPAYKKKISNE